MAMLSLLAARVLLVTLLRVTNATQLSPLTPCTSLGVVFRNCSHAKVKFASAKNEAQAASTPWATAARHFHMVHT